MAIKVCHMTSAHGPEDVRIFRKECVSLAKAGYEVYLVERGETYDKDGVHIVGIGEVTGGRVHRMWSVARQVYKKALALDCDIYHFHDPELLPYGLKLKKLGKKVIFDRHENIDQSIMEKAWIPYFIRKLVCLLYCWYEKSVCSKLDGVIYVSIGSMEEKCQKLNRNAVLLTNYPIYEEIFHKEDNPAILAFAGGIDEQWNHHVILEAVKDLPEVSHNLCGPCHFPSYMDRLKASSAWHQVNFLGTIPHTEVSDVLQKSTIGMALLTPGCNTDGIKGTMGNTKIFEEMMAGLPVICTNFERWKDFIDRYHCGICVNPKDKNEIKKAVEYLICNSREAEEMGRNGQRAIKEEFCWDMQIGNLLEMYKGIITDNKGEQNDGRKKISALYEMYYG